MIFYLFIFEFIILLLCWQKPANASCSSNNARLPRWDIVISGKMSAWKWCLPLLSHLAKKQAPHFPTIFYSIKLTIKLRTSDRLNGKKNNGWCFGFVQTCYCQSCLSIKFKFRVNYAPIIKVNSDVQTLANSKWHYWSTAAGLKIIFGWWPHTMTVQRNFCLVKSRFWPVKYWEKS